MASQIYEASDLGFNKEEIMELLDANERVLDHSLENRGTIETKIKDALRVLYPDREFDRPYL